MGCNDFLITIKCDDVHATTYWNDIQDKPEFKTINGQEITGDGDIQVAADIDTSNLVNLTDYQEIYAEKNFQRGIYMYGEHIDNRYMPSSQSFKTINGQEIKGDGDIVIVGGSGDIDMSNYPNRNNVEDIYQAWDFRNGILEYGEWIGARYMPQNQSFKTINGESILGDGNIEISGGSGGGDVPSSGTALNVKNGSGWSIQFISSFDYSGLQSNGNIDSQCLYVITD